jgi:hypothetical protein
LALEGVCGLYAKKGGASAALPHVRILFMFKNNKDILKSIYSYNNYEKSKVKGICTPKGENAYFSTGVCKKQVFTMKLWKSQIAL